MQVAGERVGVAGPAMARSNGAHPTMPEVGALGCHCHHQKVELRSTAHLRVPRCTRW